MPKRALVSLAAIALLFVSSVTGLATGSGRFNTLPPPGSTPPTVDNPRLGTPNDPKFDSSEPDDPDSPPLTPTSDVWEEQYNLFGFAPASTAGTALYHDPQHIAAGETSQRSGVSADRAWKKTHGNPEVAIAIVDTGIDWTDADLRLKVHLNRGELPIPMGPQCAPNPGQYDCNGDGAFNVADYDGDPRVNKNAGPHGIPNVIDAEDLIYTFSDGIDADGNGYVDDIAGWDFFDNDNDPYDASSYSSANFHGTGRAKDAAAETDNGNYASNPPTGDGAGVCPLCQVMILRLWDSFVAPADTYGLATLYAADNGARVEEAALGVLQNSRFSQAATEYAFHKGVALMEVSSDLNTSDHNYPTNYNNTVFVAGSVADTQGLGQNNTQYASFIQQLNTSFGLNFPIGSQVPVGTWFRNSGLTQYGGHAAIVMEGDTGSFSTGQAAGAAGMIVSCALAQVQAGQLASPLTSNEVKQIITLTAEDVVPENTGGSGAPDPSQPGWDQHFGYGRVNLRAAMDRVAPQAGESCLSTAPHGNTIPPEAGLESPPWFAPLDPVTSPTVPVSGFVSADRASSYTYTLSYAPGLEPLDQAFTQYASGSGSAGHTGALGNADLPLASIAGLLPGSAQGVPPSDPYQYAFTVRLRVTDNLGNVGEDRKTLFLYHDPTLHTGWPKFTDTGGEQSLRFADLDGNGTLEIIAANTSGEIAVYNHDGTPASYFNGGAPFVAPVPALIAAHMGAPAFTVGGVTPSHGGFSTPAIADLDRDGYPEIVAVNGDKVFALHGDGSPVAGFPVSTDPSFSAPALRTRANHVKPGIFGSAAIGDLDHDGRLDIVVASMDQHAYAWDANGNLMPGWPVLLKDHDAAHPNGVGAESINTPAIGDINGDGFPDVVVATNEIYDVSGSVNSMTDSVLQTLLNLAGKGGGNSSRLYAIQHDGTQHAGGPFLPGWPVRLGDLDASLLPLVEPGVDAIIADVNPSSPGPEVINNSFSGDLLALDKNGNVLTTYQASASGGASLSPGTIIQTAEFPAVGDITGTGATRSVFKGGLPIEQLVNLLLVGQNVPYQHVIQGWDAATGQYLPGWPRAMDDYQIFTSPAIADVGGTTDREVIAGSGLYLLHAFGPSGADLPTFPKFTGGWLSGVTAVGDLDGNGQLEIANQTREGNIFVWNTTGPACGGNNEWWGFRHDDYNSGNYATDSRPPSPILNLTGPAVGEAPRLHWTAPGDDHRCGTSSQYQVRYNAGAPVTRSNWAQATPVQDSTPPQAAGSAESFTLGTLPSGPLYFAVRAVDDAGNLAPMSNNAVFCPNDHDCDGMPDSYELAHPCLNPNTADANADPDGDGLTSIAEMGIGTDPCVADTDGDGCGDGKEVGPNPLLGGDRDPLNGSDFFDVPVPVLTSANTTGTRDHAINIQDVIAVVAYIGTSAAHPSMTNSQGVHYGSDLNANGVPDGREYDRSPSVTAGKPWRSGAPNGFVSISDALIALNQVGANCN